MSCLLSLSTFSLRRQFTAAALMIACAGAARADMYYWVGGGSTNRFYQLDPVSLSVFRFDPFSSLLDEPPNAAPTSASGNLFRPNTPGGVDGTFASEGQLNEFWTGMDPQHHLVFANTYHADRTVKISDPVRCLSMQITTRGDANFNTAQSSADELFVFGPLVRWPGCTGNHAFNAHVSAQSLWLGGSGEVSFRDLRSGADVLVKSGSATVILDPQRDFWNLVDEMAFRSGDLILRKSTGDYPVISPYITLRVGREFGGQDTLPTNIPYPGWEAVDFNPPAPPPAVHIRYSVSTQTWVHFEVGGSVHLGAVGSLIFDAPMSIDYLGAITSHAPGNGTVVQAMSPSLTTTLTELVLSNYTGTLRIQSGTLRTPVPHPLSPIVFAPTGSPTDAVLDITVPAGSQPTLENPLSGSGRIVKSGGGALVLSNTPPAFTGDFQVNQGSLITAATNNVTSIRNAVNINGGILQNGASNTIDDNTLVTVHDGRWDLFNKSETVSTLTLYGDGEARIRGGSLGLNGNLVVVPSAAATALVSGPGPLVLNGSAPRTINVGGTSDAIALNITAPVNGAPVEVAGTGVCQFSGAFNSPSLLVRSGTAQLHIPASAAKPAAITVGSSDQLSPTAPTARLILGASDQISDTLTVPLVNRADFALNGFSERIGGLSVSGAGPFSITTSDGVSPGGLDLAGDATFSGGATNFTGGLGLAGQTRTFTINSGASLTLSGQLYSGRLSKSGSGTLRLDGLESFIPIDLAGATSSVGTATVAGFGSSGTLRIDTALTVNPIASVATGFGGSFTGAGSFTKSGAGQFEFNGGAFNSYSGGTRVEGGTLFLNRFPGTTVIPGNLTVASGGRVLFAGGASHQIADAADVTVEAGGTIDMAGQTETIRNAVVSGTWTIDNASGAQGNLAATQSLFVAGGTLTGTVSGGSLTVSSGTARLRGTLPSASVGLAGTLATGGFVGPDQLTITGAFGLTSNSSTLKFTTGLGTDPALIRALGSLSYPFVGTVPVKVDQFIPQRVGTAIKLIDFGTGTSSPQLSRYALAGPAAGSGRGQLSLNSRVLSYIVTRNPCPADFDGSGTATVQDIFDFLSTWFAGTPGSDFNFSGSATVNDIFDFLAAWFQGCP